MLYRNSDKGRFTVHKFFYKPKDENDMAQLTLDIKLGEGPASVIQGPGYMQIVPDVHYHAVVMYGEIAEAMAEQLKADGVQQGNWKER